MTHLYSLSNDEYTGRPGSYSWRFSTRPYVKRFACLITTVPFRTFDFFLLTYIMILPKCSYGINIFSRFRNINFAQDSLLVFLLVVVSNQVEILFI